MTQRVVVISYDVSAQPVGPIFKDQDVIVAELVEALRYKSEGRGFDSRWCHCNFSLA